MEDDDGLINEVKAGITEYLSSDVPGFRGVLKHRYSDFNVNEIGLDGEVIHIKTTTISTRNVEACPENPLESPSYGELSQEVKDLFSPLSWARMMQISKKYAVDTRKPSEKESIRIDVTSKEKDERRLIHQCIKKHFPNLNSNTIDEGDKKYITVSYIQLKSDRRLDWPKDRPEFLHFTLYKENLDTFAALSILAKGLNKTASFFSFSGSKDKRARTTQRISARYLTAERMSKVANNLHGFKIVIGDYDYKGQRLRLGDLKGSHFKIVLRDVTKPLEEFKHALEMLRNVGFINYFGLQRFGTSSVPTSSIGLQAIKQNWENVVELILKPRPNEKEMLTKARKTWQESNNAFEAMKLMPRNLKSSIEYAVFKGLSRNNKDFVGALGHLGKNTKSIYTHAYQSLVWNEMVSKRIKKYGTKVIIGDLVQVGEPSKNVNNGKSTKTEDESSEGTNEESEPFNYNSHIKVVDEANIQDFTIYDVVMTVPGHDVIFPDNEIKSWYEERLSQDDLKKEDFKNRVKDFDLPGSYRKIIVRPDAVKWQMMGYSDENICLTLSDYDIIKGNAPFQDEGDEGKYKALILELSLPVCCYATMALREITKEDTAVSVQSKLTNSINGKRAATEPIGDVETAENEASKKIKTEQ
uniref:Pseudouridylate synthase 7 (Putative) [Xenopus (Silurana) tropicalis] n=1 Tax=Lepeophtheirus salmonis TaxID=72036 RepID=A0A0K2V6A6_LEPSM